MITATFKQEIARYVHSRLAKVVLNGSLEITEFQQSIVNDSTIALQYLIPANELPVITQIELRDETDATLSTHTVNLPVPSDTLMLQTLQIKEVNN